MEELYDLRYLEDIEESGQRKFECYLYVYPNRYRERYALELKIEIEFYPPPKPFLRRFAEAISERLRSIAERIRSRLRI